MINRICSIQNCPRPLFQKSFCSAHYKRWWRHGDPLAGSTYHRALPNWIEAHKDHEGSECLIWPFSKYGSGHAAFSVGHKGKIVSRIMCEHRHGPPPTPQHDAAHSCGKGHLACVNPMHLDWKTKSENQADRIAHGTLIRGEEHKLSKLKAHQVIEIRNSSGTLKALAAEYGVCPSNIFAIKHKIRWAWL